MIEAAGGVVWRQAASGEVEVLVVHRPRYDDWSLPKGKLDPGERAEAAALREVEEETGLRCSLGRELPAVCYVDHHGREKRARYWAMEPVSGSITANDEVDEARWLPIDEAVELLTYDRDRVIVDAVR